MHRTTLALALASGLLFASSTIATAQTYGGSWNLPGGSYQQSCINEQVRGSTLSAYCTTPDGRRVYSSVSLNGCNGDIANVNGYLRCQAGYGNGYGYDNGYGYANGYGRGDDNDRDDHRRHDRDDRVRHGHGRGNPYNGYASSGYGYNGYALPPGSYQQSCTNERMNGPILSATCTATNGRPVYSTIDVRQCQQRGAAIGNYDGYLRC